MSTVPDRAGHPKRQVIFRKGDLEDTRRLKQRSIDQGRGFLEGKVPTNYDSEAYNNGSDVGFGSYTGGPVGGAGISSGKDLRRFLDTYPRD